MCYAVYNCIFVVPSVSTASFSCSRESTWTKKNRITRGTSSTIGTTNEWESASAWKALSPFETRQTWNEQWKGFGELEYSSHCWKKWLMQEGIQYSAGVIWTLSLLKRILCVKLRAITWQMAHLCREFLANCKMKLINRWKVNFCQTDLHCWQRFH